MASEAHQAMRSRATMDRFAPRDDEIYAVFSADIIPVIANEARRSILVTETSAAKQQGASLWVSTIEK